MDELAPPVRKLLADVGYVEGRNLTVEWRAMGLDDSIGAAMAEELVRLQMDVLMTHGTPPTKAFQAATRTIPIATVVGDPIASGFTRSLARPSSNITGLSLTHPETPAKQVELLRKTLRRLERIVFIDNIDYGAFRPYEAAAKAAGIVAEIKVINRAQIEGIFAGMKRSANSAAFVVFTTIARPELAAIASRYAVPTMLWEMGYVETGGLMSFSMLHSNGGARQAATIDKLLKGVRVADIPWELPDRSHLAINLKTAKLLGIEFPPDILLSADEIVR